MKSRRAYRTSLYKYFDMLNITKPELYFKANRDYESDVREFFNKIADASPHTQHKDMYAIKMFLSCYNIEFSETQFWKRKIFRRIEGNDSVIDSKVPTNSILKTILSHGGIRDKALFSVLASSGMRLSEVCSILISDVDMTTTPTSIFIRAKYTKTSANRTVYISNEATGFLNEWLKIRETWLKQAVRKGIGLKNYNKSVEDERLFPFNINVAEVCWRRLTKASGFNEIGYTNGDTRRFKYAIHGLRKFFSTSMTNAGIPESLIEIWLGHKRDIRGIYKGFSPEKQLDYYNQGMYEVTIFESTDMKTLQKSIADKQTEIDRLKNILIERFKLNGDKPLPLKGSDGKGVSVGYGSDKEGEICESITMTTYEKLMRELIKEKEGK